MRYFVLVKRKGAKTWLGAVPARRGVSLAKLKRTVSTQLKSGFSARVVSDSQMRSMLKSKVRRTGAIRKGKKRVKKRFKRRKKR